MKVYFENGRGNEILLDETDNEDDAMRVIKRFCRERSFKIPYMRFWISPNNKQRTICDVGSHFEHFIIEH